MRAVLLFVALVVASSAVPVEAAFAPGPQRMVDSAQRAISETDHVLLAWSPPAGTNAIHSNSITAYRVYGYIGTEPTVLGEYSSKTFLATVPGGYDSYRVSGVWSRGTSVSVCSVVVDVDSHTVEYWCSVHGIAIH